MIKSSKIGRICDIFEQAGIVLIVFFASVMTISVVINILARNLFSSSFEKLEELARFMLVYVTFLGSSIVYRKEGHLGIEFFIGLFKKDRVKQIIKIFTSTFNLCFIMILIGYGGKIAFSTIVQKSLQLQVRMCYIYGIIPLSGVIFLMFFIEQILQDYATYKRSKLNGVN